MRRIILSSIFMSLLFGHHAWAFNLDACVTASMAAPYGMSESQSRAVCEAKNTGSGVANTGRFKTEVPTSSLELDARAFDAEMLRYLRGGEIKFSTCVEWCDEGRNYVPKCPTGYRIVRETMSDRVLGAYHGRYSIRAGICLKE